MNKEIIHTAPNGKKYSIQIRKYTPRDCFRLIGVHEADIDKHLTGMYLLGDFWYYDVSGELSKLMFQDKVTQVSIIDETNYFTSRRERKNPSHHR